MKRRGEVVDHLRIPDFLADLSLSVSGCGARDDQH